MERRRSPLHARGALWRGFCRGTSASSLPRAAGSSPRVASGSVPTRRKRGGGSAPPIGADIDDIGPEPAVRDCRRSRHDRRHWRRRISCGTAAVADEPVGGILERLLSSQLPSAATSEPRRARSGRHPLLGPRSSTAAPSTPSRLVTEGHQHHGSERAAATAAKPSLGARARRNRRTRRRAIRVGIIDYKGCRDPPQSSSLSAARSVARRITGVSRCRSSAHRPRRQERARDALCRTRARTLGTPPSQSKPHPEPHGPVPPVTHEARTGRPQLPSFPRVSAARCRGPERIRSSRQGARPRASTPRSEGGSRSLKARPVEHTPSHTDRQGRPEGRLCRLAKTGDVADGLAATPSANDRQAHGRDRRTGEVGGRPRGDPEVARRHRRHHHPASRGAQVARPIFREKRYSPSGRVPLFCARCQEPTGVFVHSCAGEQVKPQVVVEVSFYTHGRHKKSPGRKGLAAENPLLLHRPVHRLLTSAPAFRPRLPQGYPQGDLRASPAPPYSEPTRPSLGLLGARCAGGGSVGGTE